MDRAFLQWARNEDYDVKYLTENQSLLYQLAAAAVGTKVSRKSFSVLYQKSGPGRQKACTSSQAATNAVEPGEWHARS